MEGEKDEPKGGVKEEKKKSTEVDVGRRGKTHKFGEEGSARKAGREGGQKIEGEQKEKPVKRLAVGARLRLSTCASLAISKPRLIRQALNSSAPRVPEWSWGVRGQGQARRREGEGRHRPCSNTYSGVSEGEDRGETGEVGEVVSDG